MNPLIGKLLLAYLIVISTLTAIPLVILLSSFDFNHKSKNEDIMSMRRVIYLLALSKLILFVVIIVGTAASFLKIKQFGLIGFSGFLLAISLLAVINWWALFQVHKLKREGVDKA